MGICLHLRYLPLEALRPSWSEPGRYVLMEQDRVLIATKEARSAGVRLAMRRSGVAAVAPDAVMLDRDLHKEDSALNTIAMALLRFTPEVTYADDFCVLLDVTASLNLFRGPLSICRHIKQCVRMLGFTATMGTAPTAMGACLLSRAPIGKKYSQLRRTVQSKTMERRLNRLPVLLLPHAPAYFEWLQGIGCDSIGQLRKLPRAGLQRRTHQSLLDAMDKAFGMAPELFEWIKTPLSFSARMETHDRIEHAEALLFGAERLLLQLVGWLVSLQKAVSRFVLYLEHERGRIAVAPTSLEIALAEPAWHEEHLIRLIRERLGRLELTAPVIALRLEVLQLLEMLPPTDSLFPEPGGSPEDHNRLLELLVARLGKDNVLTLAPVPDHRPERANCWVSVTASKTSETSKTSKHNIDTTDLERPFWLLENPIQLMMRDDRPFYNSTLKIIKGPERIESGWFDDAMAARDYYIAQASDSTCYWIYLERSADPRWFLHGLFA